MEDFFEKSLDSWRHRGDSFVEMPFSGVEVESSGVALTSVGCRGEFNLAAISSQVSEIRIIAVQRDGNLTHRNPP